MNDFDTFLEQRLKEMLDPVVAVRPPFRRGHGGRTEPVLTIVSPGAELAVETIPVIAPAVASPLGQAK